MTGEASTLEHLAEMDRLLRDIQVELAPDREPEPALEAPPREIPPRDAPRHEAPAPEAPPPAPPPSTISQPEPPPTTISEPEPPPSTATPGSAAATEPDAKLQAISRLAARLVASMRELLDGYEQLLVQIPPVPTPALPRTRAERRPMARTRHDDPDVTVAAGPFATVDALRAFERAVARLPGVRDVAVRGYEGADRAIIEVRLEHRTHETRADLRSP